MDILSAKPSVIWSVSTWAINDVETSCDLPRHCQNCQKFRHEYQHRIKDREKSFLSGLLTCALFNHFVHSSLMSCRAFSDFYQLTAAFQEFYRITVADIKCQKLPQEWDCCVFFLQSIEFWHVQRHCVIFPLKSWWKKSVFCSRPVAHVPGSLLTKVWDFLEKLWHA